MSGLELRACAKINLNLKILGRREDGFHEIASVAQSISLADLLSLELTSRGIELEVDDPSIPADRTNLVWQAADLLRETAAGARTLGVRIRLRKRIPAGAGLGGIPPGRAKTVGLDLGQRG